MTVTPTEVEENLAVVRNRIADAGGDADRVVLVAVTKGFPTEVAQTAQAVGLVDLGENYAQELSAKADAVEDTTRAIRWHFIGRLQSNKVRMIAPAVSLWQSVDRASLVDEIARRAPGASILVQVNAAGEDTKGGCAPNAVADLVGRATDRRLDVRGLMSVGVAGDRAATAAAFAQVSALADELELSERSMGMTDDLDLAVKAGTTMVRLGTALFGTRPGRERVSP